MGPTGSTVRLNVLGADLQSEAAEDTPQNLAHRHIRNTTDHPRHPAFSATRLVVLIKGCHQRCVRLILYPTTKQEEESKQIQILKQPTNRQKKHLMPGTVNVAKILGVGKLYTLEESLSLTCRLT